ncbi:hypothetical protein [Spiroplasma endosymbiont of Apeira syringaria]|uniref:hypothetical protein n=1 Tax=Spiroplasma endosymbiont of Apeira syringaria TaxID=3066307 RepID=UPI0030CE7458
MLFIIILVLNILVKISITKYLILFYFLTKFNLFKAFLPLCTILILSHKCWEKPIYGLLPTFLNQT